VSAGPAGDGLLVIDELGEGMHPSLAREIVRLFQDPKTNPDGTQLVFTTHDTSLLSGRLFRRDQIWFTEKDSSGATDLYSLHDIKDVRENEAFEKGYLRGRYGAIPFFGSFDFPPRPEDRSSETSSRSETEPPGTVSRTEDDRSNRD
jgi:AAA15 family ATPase/GTPase